MYARTVRIQLKPNSVAEFTRTLEHTIIPLLRTQPGFRTRWRSSSQAARKR